MPSFPQFNPEDEANMFVQSGNDDAAASLNSTSILQEHLKIMAAVI
jgi:hypothetical protein